MKVLLTGATGFVGRNVLAALKDRNHTVRCLVRSDMKGVEVVRGNVWEPEPGALSGVDAVIHLVGIIRPFQNNTFERVHVDGTRAMVELARQAKIKKFVHMSALGARADGNSEYHRTKWAAEDLVRNSGLTHTIFRPSIIFGEAPCEFIDQMLDLVRKPVFTPVVSSGKGKLQPIYVKNVAQFFVQALTNPASDNRTFDLGGPHVHDWNAMMDIFSRAYCGKKKLKIHVPLPIMRAVAFVMERTLTKPPVIRDQLKMVREDNICDPRPAREAFPMIHLSNFDEWCRHTLPHWGRDWPPQK